MSSSDLITDRLVLRPWTAGEVAAVLDGRRAVCWADDFPAEGDRVIAGFITGHPDGLGEYGQRLIVERESGLVVGSIGLFWPPADGAVEFGYGVVASRRGRGYATEAARALVAFALASPEVKTVVASVELSNPESGRVLEKAGLRREDGDALTARYSTG
ncbi:GNAT family N-acetyltransferase [Actinomadura rubrisoli]|uniref:N-acetyltransferase n=1 Tax=Actinomadura rubrisoli TaxID=2530368 RepID=A0A4R5BE75_9ACTN|nr:GNAT family N-acetyltransferase [Actinomadura rubrisoli]TDD81892.1 N-acetyltransferase [Actinomadura rubrisoli]